MKTVVQWLDDAKAVTGSDYMTARKLNVTRQLVSAYRSGRQLPSNEFCLKLGELLDVSPLEIIASCEVRKHPEQEAQWVKWLSSAAAIFAFALLLNVSVESMTYSFSAALVCILCSIGTVIQAGLHWRIFAHRMRYANRDCLV